jgi:hypothetical protein
MGARPASFRIGSQLPQAIEGVLYARQGELVSVFLEVPIAQPTDGGQVLRFPVGVIAIEVIGGQDMAAYFEAFGPPAMFAAMPGADFGEFGHFLTVVQPFSVAVSGLEVAVQFLLGG